MADYSQLIVADEKRRLVTGFANVSVLDRQGDLVPSEAMFRAMLDYMARGGPVLFSHKNKPVGRVLQWNVEKPDDSAAEGIRIIAEIHGDSTAGNEAWTLLKSKLLTGFSIGGVATKIDEVNDESAPNGLARKLSEIELNEISLVQVPANPLATVENVSIAKSASRMDEDGRLIKSERGDKEDAMFARKDRCEYAPSKDAAEALAQALKQAGLVVYRIQRTGGKFRVDYGDNINPSSGKPNPFIVKREDDSSVPLLFRSEKAEGAPDEAHPDSEEEMKEQDTNYDQSKYGVQGSARGREEISKPFDSRAQQRWAFWSKQPWAREWAHKTDFSSLPEKKDMHPSEAVNRSTVGVCDCCGMDNVDVTEDHYGNSFCHDCGRETKFVRATFGKTGKDSWKCSHCGHDMTAPKPSAPNQRDYMWCPVCRQHRSIHGETASGNVVKDAEDGPTRNCNVGDSGLGRDTSGLAKDKKGIYTRSAIDKIMPKSLKLKKEPEEEFEEKSDTEILPYADEEKGVDDTSEDEEKVAGDFDEEEKVAEVDDEDEEEEKGTAPVPHKTTAEDFASIVDSLLKGVDARLSAMEKRLNARLEKANYTSRPPSVESKYPKPPRAGPISDGIQAPKITQSDNPNSNSFGKNGAFNKQALAGAANGNREYPGGDPRREAMEQLLAGRIKLSEIPRSVKGN